MSGFSFLLRAMSPLALPVIKAAASVRGGGVCVGGASRQSDATREVLTGGAQRLNISRVLFCGAPQDMVPYAQRVVRVMGAAALRGRESH